MFFPFQNNLDSLIYYYYEYYYNLLWHEQTESVLCSVVELRRFPLNSQDLEGMFVQWETQMTCTRTHTRTHKRKCTHTHTINLKLLQIKCTICCGNDVISFYHSASEQHSYLHQSWFCTRDRTHFLKQKYRNMSVMCENVRTINCKDGRHLLTSTLPFCVDNVNNSESLCSIIQQKRYTVLTNQESASAVNHHVSACLYIINNWFKPNWSETLEQTSVREERPETTEASLQTFI